MLQRPVWENNRWLLFSVNPQTEVCLTVGVTEWNDFAPNTEPGRSFSKEPKLQQDEVHGRKLRGLNHSTSSFSHSVRVLQSFLNKTVDLL